MIRTFLRTWLGVPDTPALPAPNPSSDRPDHVVEAALELEKRLYERSVDGASSTFGKENLVITFLTSGSLVAVTSVIQAIASVWERIPGSSVRPLAVAGIAVIVCLALGAGGAGFLLFRRSVTELNEGATFLENIDPGEPRSVVALQLIVEFRTARLANEHQIRSRGAWLVVVFCVLVATVLLALATAAYAFASTTAAPSYTKPMATPRPKPAPKPIELPAPVGDGTKITVGRIPADRR